MKILKIIWNMFCGFTCAAIVIYYVIAPILKDAGALP
jgi:hypothetical protein